MEVWGQSVQVPGVHALKSYCSFSFDQSRKYTSKEVANSKYKELKHLWIVIKLYILATWIDLKELIS